MKDHKPVDNVPPVDELPPIGKICTSCLGAYNWAGLYVSPSKTTKNLREIGCRTRVTVFHDGYYLTLFTTLMPMTKDMTAYLGMKGAVQKVTYQTLCQVADSILVRTVRFRVPRYHSCRLLARNLSRQHVA